MPSTSAVMDEAVARASALMDAVRDEVHRRISQELTHGTKATVPTESEMLVIWRDLGLLGDD